jgi:hypothetical protein
MTGRAGARFDWMSPRAVMWRQKLGTFCPMLGLNPDNYQQFLKEWFGRNYNFGLLIHSTKLPEYYGAENSCISLRAVRLVAANERERQRHRKRCDSFAIIRLTLLEGNRSLRYLKLTRDCYGCSIFTCRRIEISIMFASQVDVAKKSIT